MKHSFLQQYHKPYNYQSNMKKEMDQIKLIQESDYNLCMLLLQPQIIVYQIQKKTFLTNYNFFVRSISLKKQFFKVKEEYDCLNYIIHIAFMVGAVLTKPENFFSQNDEEGHRNSMKDITLEFNRYIKAFISITKNIANNYYSGRKMYTE